MNLLPVAWISILALWILFRFGYLDYRLDRYRQTLFALRDELFDYAADGHISFESPAYLRLRALINGAIRFGHCVNLPYMLGLHFAFASQKDKVASFMPDWESLLSPLPNEVAEHLRDVRKQLHFRVFEQVVLTSPLLLATLLPWVMVMVSRSAGSMLKQRISVAIERGWKVDVERFDYSATRELQSAECRDLHSVA